MIMDIIERLFEQYGNPLTPPEPPVQPAGAPPAGEDRASVGGARPSPPSGQMMPGTGVCWRDGRTGRLRSKWSDSPGRIHERWD